jgi:hypothetical protein
VNDDGKLKTIMGISATDKNFSQLLKFDFEILSAILMQNKSHA